MFKNKEKAALFLRNRYFLYTYGGINPNILEKSNIYFYSKIKKLYRDSSYVTVLIVTL